MAESETPATHSGVTLLPYVHDEQLCGTCEQVVQIMRTYLGRSLSFEPHAVPRDLDVNHEGWVPGVWQIKGRRDVALAPLSHYGRDKRERVTHVVLPHRCRPYMANREHALTLVGSPA